MRNKDHFKKGLVDLIKYTNIKDIKMIEIGSFSGESCEIFLSTGLIYNIICIDPWKNNWSEMSSKYNMEEVESIFDERFRNNEHVLKYKGDINSFCEKYVLNNDIDIVYIDGNHSYEYVKNDI